MGFQIERTRYGPVYVLFAWTIGLTSWAFVYNIVGLNLASIEQTFQSSRLVASFLLLVLVVCAFTRYERTQSSPRPVEEAIALCIVLLYPLGFAVAIIGTGAVFVTVSLLSSRRLRQSERGSWPAFVGEVLFQSGLMAFITLAGHTVFRLLYQTEAALWVFSPNDLWRLPLIFLAMYAIRFAILFVHSWTRGVPLVIFVREIWLLRSRTGAMAEIAALLLGISMAFVAVNKGTPIFAALGGVYVLMVFITERHGKMRETMEARIAELQVLNGAGRILTESTQRRETILEALETHSRTLFGADSFALYFNPASELAGGSKSPTAPRLVVAHLAASAANGNGAASGEAALPLAEWCVKALRPLRIDDASSELKLYDLDRGIAEFPWMSWLGAPLESKGALHGVISVACRGRRAFTEQHQELLKTLAHHAVAALESAHLFEIANVDALTGLVTPRALRARLADEFARAVTEKRSLGLIMLDVDHFKRVNDTYGHEVGNEVLSAIANLIASRLRGTDTAGRYGGEEFTILLPGAPAARAVDIAERLREAISERPLPTSAGALPISASFGVATFPATPAADPAALLAAADAALYRSKGEGRNRVTQADAENEE